MQRAKRIYRTRYRKLLSRSLGLALFLLVLFTRIPTLLQLPAASAMGLVGLLLASVAAFGRIWTSLYISGRKSSELVSQGPYSITRNPLYLFSLLGAVGLGLASCNHLVLLCLIPAFIIYYRGVILQEENKLSSKHGDSFEEYLTRVPRLFPKLSLYEQPEQLTVHTRPVSRAIADAVWFILGYIALRIVVWLHVFNILPALEIRLY